mgnify:FL=1
MSKFSLFKCASVMCASLLFLTGCATSNSTNSSTSASVEASGESLDQSSSVAEDAKDPNKKISIVTTIFPEYDWVREIVGNHADKFEITYLMNKGVDLHSYQASAEDIAKVSSADLFIYVGGESDTWAEDAIAEATNKEMKVINLLNSLGSDVKEEEVVEGMEAEDEHDHDHSEEAKDHDHADEAKEHDHDHDHAKEGEEVEYDEHVWLSLKNAQKLVMDIEANIESLDPDNAADYAANAQAYVKKLEELDKEYQKAVDESSVKYILVGDRFPFRYLVDDYGLKYSAAFVGCSAETEASFDTITFLAGKLDELGLKNVVTIENSNQKIAKTIIENTKNKDQGLLVLNSLQSVSQKDIDGGLTYLSVMKDNLEVLKKALTN